MKLNIYYQQVNPYNQHTTSRLRIAQEHCSADESDS